MLLSLKAQLPLLMNRPREGVQALHDLLQYCRDKADVQHASAGDDTAPEGGCPLELGI